MSQAAQKLKFTSVETFEAWAESQPERWELHDGCPVAMAPERAGHARIKANVYRALHDAIGAAGLPCEALIDGLMVPGPGLRRFIPDVIVVCGERPADNDQLVEAPLIVVEVLSPATENVDMGVKLASYLTLPSVQHYLIVHSAMRAAIHHRRWNDAQFLTTIVSGAEVEFAPPGIFLALQDIYAGTELAT